jgi:hypothetical protein
LLAGACAGCQSQPAAPAALPVNQITYLSPTGQAVDAPMPAPPTAGQMSADQIVDSDPAAVRLQDIEGLLLEFYALNRRLPTSLEEARSLADADAPADLFVSPDTHTPFTYTAAGLGSASNSKRIILYESVSHAGGQRWCILMPPPAAASPGSASMEVISLPESVFGRYKP